MGQNLNYPMEISEDKGFMHHKPTTKEKGPMTMANTVICPPLWTPPMIMPPYCHQQSMSCLPFQSLYLMVLIYSTFWHKFGFWSGKSQCWLVIDVPICGIFELSMG